jgi:hypothetical protein
MDQWLKQTGKLQGKNSSNARTNAPHPGLAQIATWQQKKDFAKHATNSRRQCNIFCSKNVVQLPHISGNFSREGIVVVKNKSRDIKVKTVRRPLLHNNF